MTTALPPPCRDAGRHDANAGYRFYEPIETAIAATRAALHDVAR